MNKLSFIEVFRLILVVFIISFSLYNFFQYKQIGEISYLKGLFVFYLPASLTLIATIENKPYLLFLAFLLYSTIIFDYPAFGNFDILFFSYLGAISIMAYKNNKRN